MAVQEFGYVPSNERINTAPKVLSIPVGGGNASLLNKRSKAADDIDNIMKSVLKVGQVVADEMQYNNKVTQQEASKRLVEAKLKTQEDLTNVDKLDIVSIEAINERYNSITRSVIDGAELPDTYKVSLDTAAMEYGGKVRETTTKMITEAKTTFLKEDVANNMIMLHNMAVGDEATKGVFDDLKKRFYDLGITNDAAEEFIASKYAETKLSTLDVNTVSGGDIDKMINDSKEYLKSYLNPKLIGKPVVSDFTNKLEKIKSEVIRNAQNVLSDYAINDGVSLSTLKGMVTEAKAKGNLTDIEAANLLQSKKDRLETLYYKQEARRQAAEDKIAREAYQNLQAVITNPLIEMDEKNKRIQEAYDKGYISSDVAGNFASDVIVDESKARSKEFDSILLEQKQLLADADYKTQLSLKGTDITPEVYNGLLLQTTIKDGKVMTAEQQKKADDYTLQYNAENNPMFVKDLFTKDINDFKAGQDGLKKGVGNLIDTFMSNENFNPKAVAELSMRYKARGNVDSIVTKELQDKYQAVNTINKFKQLNDYNRQAAIDFYGKDNYAMLAGLAAVAEVKVENTKDNQQVPYVDPNLVRKQIELRDNKDIFVVNMEKFNDALKDNPSLYQDKAVYEALVRNGTSPSDAIDIVKERAVNINPVVNVDLSGYGKVITDNDKKYLEQSAFFIKTTMKDKGFVGMSYNSNDGNFYYSKVGDKYAQIIAIPDGKGKAYGTGDLVAINSFFENKILEKGAGQDNPVKKAVDGIKIFNKPTKEEVKAFTNSNK